MLGQRQRDEGLARGLQRALRVEPLADGASNGRRVGHLDPRALTDPAIDRHVKNLRRKRDAVPPGQAVVRLVYGVGYRFEPVEDPRAATETRG